MSDVRGPYRRYIMVLGLLVLLALAVPTTIWKSSTHFHTILEVVATVVAGVVGSLALVRFYSKKSNRFLFIGTGFMATAFFDGYHGLVTSEWFYRNFPADLAELAPWSWLVSRLFLSILLWLSVVTRSDDNQGKRGEVMVYLVVSLLGLLFFIFFTQDPLPQAYLQDWLLHRPMELVPAFFFLLALFAYYKKGDWRHDAFERWLLLALIISLAVQSIFMPRSFRLYDGMFDLAHLLKIISYLFVFVGLASSMSELVEKVEESSHSLRQVNQKLQLEVQERLSAEQKILVYQDIVKNMQVGVIVFHLDVEQDLGTLRITIANQAAARFLARSVEEILHTQIADSFPDSLSTQLPYIFREVILSGQTQDLGEIHYVGDGIDSFFAVKAFPLPNQLVGITFDNVTKRKEAEEQLRQRTTQLAEAQRLANLGSWDWHVPSGQISWSNELYRIFGYEPQSFPVTIETFIEHVHPDDKEMVSSTLQEVLEKQKPLLYYPRIVRPSGDMRVIHGQGTVVVDENEQPVRMWGTAQDITERFLAEEALRESAAKLEASNRELQEFAYIASHDLQEPLRKINAFSDRLKSRYGDSLPDRAKDYLDRMQNAATRMQHLIEDLLTLSRVTTKGRPFTQVDLTLVANEVIDDLETAIEESNGQVEVADLPIIEADQTQMRQLLQNTISNALKFARKGVPPVVKIKSMPRLDSESFTPQIQMTISDNGIGFKEKYIDRIFQPFQRLHGRNKYAGTGMGLAICRKIVERHNGSITATSVPEEGTTIIITLPIKQLVVQDTTKENK